jgi:hypothetical protein
MIAAEPVVVWLYRHAEIPSHRGDLPATEAGLEAAEAAGATTTEVPTGALASGEER